MTDDERYLFDLQGFLVVPGALDEGEVAALNALADEQVAVEVQPGARNHRFDELLDWGPPYRALIDHPRVVPYLAELLGDRFRLDHVYLDLIRSGKGPVGTVLHGGATPYDPAYSYRYDNGRMRNGLTVVAYNLADVNPGDGGFAAVPGSHKANLPFPADWRDLDVPHPCVLPVTGPAGTAILFTEALTHGTLPWTAAHERRTIFYKYSPNCLSWSAHYYDADACPDLTDRQRAILEPPNARYAYRKSRRLLPGGGQY